ncbi:MAG TPA: BTAD domain-containing putative transcriptional regulator [Actinocrinis sp.]|nr:BTAD domain-containing putative transcriptional regulator [Actinocrinis sp.]
MYFRVLGPIELWNEDRQYSAGTLKEQQVLAVLLLEAGRAVSAHTLADRVWDDRPPQKARETLQVYLSRLRGRLKAAGDDVGLIGNSGPGGYRLDVGTEQVDFRRFERLIVRARAAASKPDPESARTLLREAEKLWRGDALGGLGGGWVEATRQALAERRRSATLTRIELDLRLGGHRDDLISELIRLSGEQRIDQTAVGLLMRALSDVGRQDEALATYRSTRDRLRDELGVDPRVELQALHQRILRGEPGLALGTSLQPTPAVPAPDTIDRDPPHLVGRDEELSDLLAAIERDLRTMPSVAICALDGMPGVGKTALAVRAARRLRAHCSDGALQLNLRAHDLHQPPLSAREALTRLLEDVAVPPAELGRTDSLDALAALWRRRTSGRRLLLLLDDVANAEQIAPLLPTTSGSIVLLTSRHRLAGVTDARHHTVRLLSHKATQTLLERITGREFAEQTEDLARYVRRCAGLALAISMSAAFLRGRPQWTLADLVDRLDVIAPTATATDSLTGPIHAAFTASYQALPELSRTLLRRLAAHPGQEIGVHAAAALLSADLTATSLAADELVEQHLSEETERHRYRLHDLTRQFALARINLEGDQLATQQACARALDYYLAAAVRAEHTLRPYRRVLGQTVKSTVTPLPAIENVDDAQHWFDRECDNIIAIAAYAYQHRYRQHAALLPLALAQHLDRRGNWGTAAEMLRQAREIAATAATAATAADLDDAVIPQLTTDLAAALVRTGQLDAALSWASTALDVWSAHGDKRGQADALLEIGRIHWYARRLAAAHDAYRRSSQLHEQIGDRRGRVVADYHLSIIKFELGNAEEALQWAERLVQTARADGDHALECDVLTNLGEMHRLSGQFEEALGCFRSAQLLAQRLADPHNLAVLANNIGAVHDRLGNLDEALESFNDALRLFQALGDGRNLVDTLVHLAGARIRVARLDEAAAHIDRGFALAAQLNDPLRQARLHLVAGQLQGARNNRAEAVESLQTALTYAQRAAALLEQARVLHALGDICAADHDETGAREHWRRAAELYRQLDHPDADLIPG